MEINIKTTKKVMYVTISILAFAAGLVCGYLINDGDIGDDGALQN